MAGALAATALMTATIPMIVAGGVIVHVTRATYGPHGEQKAVGVWHYHFRSKTGKAVFRHRHQQGAKRHEHERLFGYGKSRKSLKR